MLELSGCLPAPAQKQLQQTRRAPPTLRYLQRFYRESFSVVHSILIDRLGKIKTVKWEKPSIIRLCEELVTLTSKECAFHSHEFQINTRSKSTKWLTPASSEVMIMMMITIVIINDNDSDNNDNYRDDYGPGQPLLWQGEEAPEDDEVRGHPCRQGRHV